MNGIFQGTYIRDLYDLYDLNDLAHVAGMEKPHHLHELRSACLLGWICAIQILHTSYEVQVRIFR